MVKLQTSLLREKFTVHDPKQADNDDITAMSNRMVITLNSPDGIDNETFVLRTQNMHSCARLGAAILKEFHENGTLAYRAKAVEWNLIWGDVIKGYERAWNPDIWCVIYHKGRPVFQQGEHHPFLDIIEKCDAAQQQEYTESVVLAEKIFGQAGKLVKIHHDSNVALVVHNSEEEAKCGIIVRGAGGTTTFNFTATPHDKNPRPLHPYTTLSVAASMLEMVQLGFKVGILNKKVETGLIERFSQEDKHHKKATSRLGNINKAILNFEDHFNVKYRPERPTSKQIVTQAENAAIKILAPEIKQKLEDGEISDKDWIV